MTLETIDLSPTTLRLLANKSNYILLDNIRRHRFLDFLSWRAFVDNETSSAGTSSLCLPLLLNIPQQGAIKGCSC